MMLPTTENTATRFGTARMRELRQMTGSGSGRLSIRALQRAGRRRASARPAAPVPVAVN